MLRYLLAVLALVGLDQWVKYWTVSHLALGETAPLLEGFLRLHRVHNTGGGWSILSGHTWLLTLLTAAVLAAILVLAARGAVRHPFGRWMAAVLFAGQQRAHSKRSARDFEVGQTVALSVARNFEHLRTECIVILRLLCIMLQSVQ